MPQAPRPDPPSGVDLKMDTRLESDKTHSLASEAETPPTIAQLARHLRAWGVFLAAALAGTLFQPQIGRLANSMLPPPADPSATKDAILYWTSPMDRSFRADKPGQDTMGMSLVPVYVSTAMELEPLRIDPVPREHEFTTGIVEQGPWVRTVKAMGTVTVAEPLVGEVALKMDAWVEKLFVDYEGQPVRKGEPLFEVYSPELVLSQDEFLSSQRALEQATARSSDLFRQDAQANLDAVREKLLYLDVTQQQIDDLARQKKVRRVVTFYSAFDGIVLYKAAFAGTFAKAGSLMYQIVDLSKVWVNLYLEADQTHCVQVGQQAKMTLTNLPGYEFSGKLIYIYPDLDPKTRTLRVRLEFLNPDLLLKPGMFTNVVLAPHNMGDGLLIPQQAVLKTGTREVVYVALADEKSQPTGTFEVRPVTTGMRLDGNKVQLLEGLQAKEQIVLSGNFLFDSESRLRSIDRKMSASSARMKEPSPSSRDVDMSDMSQKDDNQ